jgi:hypothetical protein
MSDYKNQLQRIIKEYRQDGQAWPASTSDIARRAIGTERYDLPKQTINKICARELAQAMREEYITDPKGRRVRAKHPAKVKSEGEQKTIWDDIRTAPRTFMEMAFANRRNHIVGECRQAKTDVDSYNDAHPTERPIQMVLDFTQDVEELEEMEELGEGGIEEVQDAEEKEYAW